MAKDREGEGDIYQDGLSAWFGVKITRELIRDAKDQARWREMTANAYQHALI